MPGNITISAANLPVGTCPAWIIPLWAGVLAPSLSANLNGALNVFNYGNSTPAPADQGKPWIRLDSSGRTDKVYVYSGGAWIALHPDFTGKIVMWEGDITTIDTLDGGEAAAITVTTGPMWQRVTELQAKFPLGAGTLPSGAVKAVGNVGGEENHVLTVAELAAHHHNVQVSYADVGGGSAGRRLIGDAPTTQPEAVTDDAGSGTAHNTLPPYFTLHFIRRTARLYYRI